MLGLFTSPRTQYSLITTVVAVVPQTKLGHSPMVGLGGPLVWICLEGPFLAGPLCPSLFLALCSTCQVSPGLRPSAPLVLVYSVTFVFPDSCHQGSS